MTRLVLAVALMAALVPASAPADADMRFARLSEPGVVAVMRHALAPGSGDSASFALLRKFLLGLSRGETVVLVTHYVNIQALTGRGVASGEVLLLEIGRDAAVSVADGILIDPQR